MNLGGTKIKIRLAREQPIPPEELQARVEAASEMMVPQIVPSVTLLVNTLVKLRLDELTNRVRNRLTEESKAKALEAIAEQVPILYQSFLEQLYVSLKTSLYAELRTQLVNELTAVVIHMEARRIAALPWWKRWLH